MSNDRRSARLRHTHDLADIDFTGTLALTGSLVTSGNVSVGGNLAVTGLSTFNNTATFAVPTLFADGAVGTPSIAFTLDTNTGIWRRGADLMSFSTGGAERLVIGNAGNTSRVVLLTADGSATAPGYAFDNQSNSGMFRPGSTALGFAIAGAERFRYTNSPEFQMWGSSAGNSGAYIGGYEATGATRYGYLQFNVTGPRMASDGARVLEFYTNNALRTTWQAAGHIHHSASLSLTGWVGSTADFPASQHSLAFGVQGGYGTLHSYSTATNTYQPMAAYATFLEIIGPSGQSYLYMNGKNTIRNTDGFMRLNQDGHFTNGVYTPGEMRIDATLRINTDIQNVAGTKQLNLNSLAGLSHGTAYLTGASGSGYHGLAIFDGGVHPTLMGNGSTAGVYNQGHGSWMIYVSDSTYVRSQYKLIDTGGQPYWRYTNNSTSTGGLVTIQSGGSPSGGTDGDVFLIY
jgi:hypothetical protein